MIYYDLNGKRINYGLNGERIRDEFKITKRMIYKTKLENFWRKRVTSNPNYKLFKYRLMMLKKIFTRNNGLALFEVKIKNDNYYYNLTSSSLFTTQETYEGLDFIHNVLKRRVKTIKKTMKAESIINEANSILNVKS